MKRFLFATIGLMLLGSTALAQCNVSSGYQSSTRSFTTARTYSQPTVREVVREVQAPPVREIVREEVQPTVVREVVREVEVPVVRERVVFRDTGSTYYHNYNEFRSGTNFRDDGRFRDVRFRDSGSGGGGGRNVQLGLFNSSSNNGGGRNFQIGLINRNR